MTTVSSMTRVGPRKMKKFALRCLVANVVPFIQGSPGVGKSAIMAAIAKELNLFLIDHRLSTSPPEDMSGLPRFDEDGFAYFAPFRELFPLEDTPLPVNKETGQPYAGWLLFLDEFNSAQKMTMAAAYKLILDRKVGQHNLHPCCVIAAAGNLATDRAIVNPLSTAMKSRVTSLELECVFDEWLMDVALKQGYDQRIIAYLSQYPSHLMDFTPTTGDQPFCCPRTWEFINELIYEQEVVDGDVALYAGTITAGVAADFVQFCQIYKDMPKVEDILSTPETYPIPREVGMRWAITTALLQHVNEDALSTIAKYIDRMDTSFRILFYRSVMVNHQNLRHHPAYTRALIDLVRYLKED